MCFRIPNSELPPSPHLGTTRPATLRRRKRKKRRRRRRGLQKWRNRKKKNLLLQGNSVLIPGEIFFLFLAILLSFFHSCYFFSFLCVAKEEDIGLSRQSRNRFLNLFPVFLTGNPGVPGFFLINKQRSTINYVLSLLLSCLT